MTEKSEHTSLSEPSLSGDINVKNDGTSPSSTVIDPELMQKTIKDITSNPDMMDNITRAVMKNPQAFASMGDQLGIDENIKNQAVKAIANDPAAKQRVAQMSPVEKDMMAAQCRAEQLRMIQTRSEGVRVTQTKQLKKFYIVPGFPAGSIFASGDCYDIENGKYMVYTTNSSAFYNKYASEIVGADVFGEIVITKKPIKGELEKLQVNEVANLRKKILERSK